MVAGSYDCWCFDLDGTLVDVNPGYIESVLTDTAEALETAFDNREQLQLWYGTDGVRRATLDSHGISVAEFWRTFEQVRTPGARVDASFLYPDAEAVGRLDAPVGLVTHCPREITLDVLEALDIRDWFDAVVCCDEEVGWKPDARPVHRTLKRMAVDPKALANGTDGALVGDAPCDVGAAWNAGLDGIHVERHDPTLRGRCVRADHRVDGIDGALARGGAAE